MVELTIDGKTVSVPEGSMVMHAATELGVFVPHFCYHKKLSIAANCRMCLVEVEKMPKAVPACATPVTNGMVVHTCSAKAVAAQKAVMEFLLINHPLDCPICDQGGECQLQDLAVGYGQTETRYSEEKRVVFHKDLGPLVSAQEMSRCIQCTRCVRFGEEIAGIMELGMINRGEHSEITTFMSHSVSSELSGNAIDLCPVGALTSKPFRYHARTWELARRYSISPHDSVGANLVVQVKNDQVMRVVPFENEAVNECWISNRDRWSYEGLNAEDRLTVPMIKGDDGVWREASWTDALTATTQALSRIKDTQGADKIAALATEYATVEEYALLARVLRGLGSDNIDARLQMTDGAYDDIRQGVPWLGTAIADLNQADRIVVIGSDMRQEHPLLTQRIRQAAKQGCVVTLLDCDGNDPYIKPLHQITVAPAQLAQAVADLTQAVAQNAQNEFSATAQALRGGERVLVLLGNFAMGMPNASELVSQAQDLATALGGKLGFMTAGANTVGAYLAGAVPMQGGLNLPQMLNAELGAFLVLHAEPLLDAQEGQKLVQKLSQAFSIALTSYRSAAQDWAKIMLPVSPFTETSGTFVNAEGRAQSFKGVVPPPGQSRPAWKVLRVLGNILKIENCEDESSESVRDSVLSKGFETRLNNTVSSVALKPVVSRLQRVADTPVYRTDAMVRRSEPLQEDKCSALPKAYMNQQVLTAHGLVSGDQVKVSSEQGSVVLEAALLATLPDNTVKIAQSFAHTAVLGNATTSLKLERV